MEFFNLYLDDLDMLFMSLELYFRRKLTPRQTKGEEARSLVIFDEVQFCPRARAAIKHLVADRRYDYIETGSLISIKKNVKDIMLPSEEHAIEMFPMDFEEFLWAMGDEMLMPYIRMRFDKRLPMEAFHRRAMDYFEKKFVLSALQSEARMRDYSQAFFWLSDAKIINCCYNSTAPSIGLKLNEERTTLKCYMGDTGLLISHAFDERGIVSADLYRKLMFDKLEVNEGMLVENIVAQMLRAAGHKLYFFSNSSRTSVEDRMEIDFLIAKPVTTSRHNISPIEVKSGQRYTLNSLRKCIAKYGSQLSMPYVLHDKDMKIEDGIVYLPIYMTPLL